MREQILQMAQSQPQLMQGAQQIAMQLRGDKEVMDDLDSIISILESALQSPDNYARLRQELASEGIDDLPVQFDASVIFTILLALYLLQGQNQQPQGGVPAFRRGGLNSMAREVARAGRNGDRMLAHITPAEAQMLKRHGGAGTVNPETGLPEFFSLKKLAKSVTNVVKKAAPVLPFVIPFAAPIVGAAISSGLVASGLTSAALGATAQGIIGGAVLGGGIAKLTDGNVLQGATMGALGGGAAGVAGKALAPGMGAFGQQVLGGTAIGGALGAATGQGFKEGAMQGAIGQAAGAAIGGMAGPGAGAAATGIRAGGNALGNVFTVTGDPKASLKAGATAGLLAAGTTAMKGASDIQKTDIKAADKIAGPVDKIDPAEYNKAVAAYNDPTTSPAIKAAAADIIDAYEYGNGNMNQLPPNAAALSGQPAPSPAGTGLAGTNIGFNMPTLAGMGAIYSMMEMAKTPAEVQSAINEYQSNLSPQQQEFISRPLKAVNWDTVQQAANQAGMGLGQYVAQNWDKLTYGQGSFAPQEIPKYARGGPLTQLARGGGSGRDDSILAKLSDGEYVIDAETVAMLGDGSTDEGARRLDSMRKQVRSHKGKALARGKISPNAKSPLAYLKGA